MPVAAPPVLVAVGGLSGSGKSTLARALAPHLDALVLRSDVIRKELMEVEETVRLGPDGYRPEVTARVYGTLFERAGTALATGQAVILDAVFSKAHERESAVALATAAGVLFSGLWLEVPLEVALSRIASRTGDASDATPRVRIMQEERLERPVLWPQLDGSLATGEGLIPQALELLANALPRNGSPD